MDNILENKGQLENTDKYKIAKELRLRIIPEANEILKEIDILEKESESLDIEPLFEQQDDEKSGLFFSILKFAFGINNRILESEYLPPGLKDCLVSLEVSAGKLVLSIYGNFAGSDRELYIFVSDNAGGTSRDIARSVMGESTKAEDNELNSEEIEVSSIDYIGEYSESGLKVSYGVKYITSVAVEIDPTFFEIRPATLYDIGKDYVSIKELVEAQGALAGINGNFFGRDNGGMDSIMIYGEEISKTTKGKPSLVFLKNGSIAMDYTENILEQYGKDIVHLMKGVRFLIKDGNPVNINDKEFKESYPKGNAVVPRSAVCLKENGNIVFYATAKNRAIMSIDPKMLIDVMNILGCHNAVELDGCASAQIYENGNEHCKVCEEVPNGIRVFRKKFMDILECTL
jgi:exopolysaccharide biosynthesis protein